MRTAIVVATVEYLDGRVSFVTWKNHHGSTIRDLKARIRAHYRRDNTVAHVGLGNGIYQNSYGAH